MPNFKSVEWREFFQRLDRWFEEARTHVYDPGYNPVSRSFGADFWTIVNWIDANTNLDPAPVMELRRRILAYEHPHTTYGPQRSRAALEDVAGRVVDLVERLRNASVETEHAERPNTVLQRMILGELDGRALTGEQLMVILGIGSKETIFGKRGKGGLSDLARRGLIKNDRQIGGYYRPDSPPN